MRLKSLGGRDLAEQKKGPRDEPTHTWPTDLLQAYSNPEGGERRPVSVNRAGESNVHQQETEREAENGNRRPA